MDGLPGDIVNLLARLDERMASLIARVESLAASAVARPEHDALKARVSKLEAWQTAHEEGRRWVFRTVVGVVLVAITAAVVALVLSEIGLKP